LAWNGKGNCHLCHDVCPYRNQATVHRILNLGGERYVLVAITASPSASPEILDPALPRIEALLGRPEWQLSDASP